MQTIYKIKEYRKHRKLDMELLYRKLSKDDSGIEKTSDSS